MKKYFLFLITVCALGSCDDYLDVKPKSQIEEGALFQTHEGFVEALNGVYGQAVHPDFYGGELTFGFLDVLAQNYSTNIDNSWKYGATRNFDYTESNFVRRKDLVWSALYNAIAHCNLILEHIDEKKNVFRSEEYYRIIKGEALALRAYFHLDALRMFGYSLVSDPSTPVIPYVTTFTNKVTAQSPTEEVLGYIIEDLTAALDLLATADPIVSDDYVVGYTTDGDDEGSDPDDESTEETSADLFLQNRRHHMNYYAVCGTLARAYLCRGNENAALEFALRVIGSDKFPWTDASDFAAPKDEEKDRVLYKELVFGWYIPRQYENLNNRFGAGTQGMYTSKPAGDNLFETGGPGAEDLRYKQWLEEYNDLSSSILLLEKFRTDGDDAEDRLSENRHYLMAPAIRLSEMYYIAAECTYSKDVEEAWGYFNTVRYHRGIAGAYEKHGAVSRDEFLAELTKEARKEFFGEGQIFYMYKRLNRSYPGQGGATVPAGNEVFVLPLPDDEISFGGRN